MADIIILGAGVMGSALAVPAAANATNQVTLVGSPLDSDIIDSIQRTRVHPNLKTDLPNAIHALKLDELKPDTLKTADVIIIGVSSPGIDWASTIINDANATPDILGLVTKGLVANTPTDAVPLTYADALPSLLTHKQQAIVGIGGPCIARELALGLPTRVTFAANPIEKAVVLRGLLQTNYYRITTHTHIAAVEACAALKNFLCIGVSAMMSAYPLDNSHAKNPVAALYNQAVLELLILSRWIAASEYADKPTNATHDVAFDLAGMGDLHVTVGGGRNSLLGTYLGRGQLLEDIISNDMAGVTVEGVDTGHRLAAGFHAACATGALNKADLPLTAAILNSIESNAAFDFNFITLPG